MKRFLSSLFLCIGTLIVGGVFISSPVAADDTPTIPTADHWIYPVGAWRITTHQGDEIGTGYYHMGIDVGFELGAGSEVYAMSDGIVREAQERTQFGLVVLIESVLPDDSHVVSLYGHMRPSDIRVTIGQTVHAGDVVGVMGDSSENGGWSPHLHVGIHKGEYTGQWVYYGHVRNPDTANEWYSPETFVPDHLTVDTFKPNVVFSDLTESQIIGDDVAATVGATDIGSGVATLRMSASDDGKKTWTTLADYTVDQHYPTSTYFSLAGLKDGVVYVRAVATDAFGNAGKKTIQLSKKVDAPITLNVAAISGAGEQTQVNTAYQTGEVSDAFTPFDTTWDNGGDIAVGYLKGAENALCVATVKTNSAESIVKVFTKGGTELDQFSAFTDTMTDSARVASGDVNGDGTDEIIVGSGPGVPARVRVFDRHGTLLTELQPFPIETTSGVDVATGDVNGDGTDEIIVGARRGTRSKIAVLEYDGTRVKVFRAFKKRYLGGVNVSAGDIDGDGTDEIIVGSGGIRIGTVRVFGVNGVQKGTGYIPFGDTFTGAVDVASTDWEQDGTDEIMMSQASDGEAWVKTYRFDAAQTVVTAERMFDQGFTGGGRIAGWK